MRTRPFRRIATSSAAMLVSVAGVGAFVAATATAAGAGAWSGPVLCDSELGAQEVEISVELNVSTNKVKVNETFVATIPGGEAELPDNALNGAVHLTQFENLTTSYTILNGGTFVEGTAEKSAPATINGTEIPMTASINAKGDVITFKLADPAIPPGTLFTPDWTVDVLAPAKSTTLGFYANKLTTTAWVKELDPGNPFGAPVPVVCNIPATILEEVVVGAGGDLVVPTTATTLPPTTVAPPPPPPVVVDDADLPLTGKQSGALALAGLAATATGGAFLIGARRRRSHLG